MTATRAAATRWCGGTRGLVRSIAGRYKGRGLAYEDIVQTGYIGLIQAVDRYEPSRGVPLRAYAARTIDGEIMHMFRDQGWAVRVPRSLQELSRRIATTRDRLSHQLGRPPSLEELADATGEPPDVVAEGLAAHRAYAAQTLDRPVPKRRRLRRGSAARRSGARVRGARVRDGRGR